MEDMLTVQEAARAIRVHTNTVYKAIEEKKGVGKLFVRTPKLVIRKQNLVNWVEEGCPQ